jgi:two-component system, cell cycle response regulator
LSEENTQSQVLVVDDSRVIRRAATKILEKEFDVVEAEDGEYAWEELQQNKNISVVFSDLSMPNMDGYELLEKIRNSEDPAIASLPVIIITGAESSEGAKEEVFAQGATDFITKPFDSMSLKSRASAYINYRNEVKTLEKKATTDKLTGLATEAAFKQQGDQALAYAKRHCTEITVVRFDIDKFAELFVKHGKEIAEQILAKVASIILAEMRKEDIAARMGVSRFSLMLPCADPDGAAVVVGRICERVAKLKLKLGKDVFHISFSTGTTSPEVSDDCCSFDTLMEQAETSLKQAVNEGGGKIIRYQTGKAVEVAGAIEQVDVLIDELIKQVSKDDKSVTNQQLASAMRKFLPLMAHADSQLKLGLSKVVLHLKNRLKT